MVINIGRNKVPILIDEEDYIKFFKKGFCFNITEHGYVRCITYEGKENGKYRYKQQYLHRMIMNVPKGMFIDHINHDTKDNRKSNLRVCTSKQNSSNARQKKGKFKGVHLNKTTGKWIAQITRDRKCKHIGVFNTETEAAIAYNKKAKEFYGEFAYLNTVPSVV